MAAATQSRNTQRRETRLIPLPVKAATKIFLGTMVARDASGWAVPAADAANLKVVGLAKADVDNSAGANGDLSIEVEVTTARMNNSGTNALTKADVTAVCYVEDDQTVSAAGGTNSIKAGSVVEVDADGVWVNLDDANVI